MNYVRLIERVGDIASAVGESTEEQRRVCESAMRLVRAGEMEDANNLLAKAVGMGEANERVLTVLRAIFVEIELDRAREREYAAMKPKTRARMISFLLRNIASLEDNLKEARRKDHTARADNLRVQLMQARADLTKRLLADNRRAS